MWARVIHHRYLFLLMLWVGVLIGGKDYVWAYEGASEASPKFMMPSCAGTPSRTVVWLSDTCVSLFMSVPHWRDPWNPPPSSGCNYEIDWGDGSPLTTGHTYDTFRVTHCYPYCGRFYVSYTLDCNCQTTVGGFWVSTPLDVDVQVIHNPCDLFVIFKAIADTSSVIPPINYQWDFGDGTTATGDSVSHTYAAGGSYLVSLTVTGSHDCRKDTFFWVHIESPPQWTMPDTVRYCWHDTAHIGPPIITSGAPPYTYEWFPATGVVCDTCPETDVLPPSDTFMYHLVITGSNGCTDTDSVVVMKIPEVFIDITPDSICPYDTAHPTVVISGGEPPFTYEWTPNYAISCTNCPLPVMYPIVTTEYIFTVTDPNGCYKKDTVEIFVFPKVDIAMPDTHEMCIYDTLRLAPAVSGGTPPYVSYTWTPDQWMTCDTCPITYVYPPRDTEYILTVVDAQGCDVRDTTYVRVWPLPEINLKDTSICEGDTIWLYPGGPYAIYQWWPNYAISCLDCDSVQVYPTVPTTYHVYVMSIHNCENEDSITVTPYPWPVPMLPDSVATCAGHPVTLYAGQASSYWWEPAGLVPCPVCDSNTVKLFTPTWLYVELQNEIGCTLWDSVYVWVAPSPQAKAWPDTVICLGDTVALYATGGWIYEWKAEFPVLPDAVSSYPPGQNVTDTVYLVPQRYTDVVVRVGTDTTLCPWDSASVHIDVDSGFIVTAYPDTIIIVDDSVQLHAYYTTDEWYIHGHVFNSVATYRWEFQGKDGVTFNPYEIHPVVSFSDTGTWWFYFVSQTIFGCPAKDSVQIIVIDVPCTDSVVFHPLAFTPNGDGVNDVLYLYSARPTPVQLWRIYDRWGNLLFEARNFMAGPKGSTAGWDGYYQGELMRPDVYVYYVYFDCEGKRYFIKGDVSLLR